MTGRSFWCRTSAMSRSVIGGTVALLLLMLCGQRAVAAETETWVDATGKFRIEASFVSVEDGVVTLEREGGSQVEVPLDKLSDASQKRVKELLDAMVALPPALILVLGLQVSLESMTPEFLETTHPVVARILEL